jgi:dipeptidyl-peptidase-4
MTRSRTRLLALSALLSLAGPLPAQHAASTLSVDRIFASGEFAEEEFGPARWLDDGSGYTTLEPSTSLPGGTDVVRYAPETGRRDVLVSARALVPAGAREPLEVEDYAWSPDGSKLLVFTNSRRVWRANTRGDYWVLDRASGRLRKLGGAAPPSTLMFATFSPDGGRVAYVRQNDLYVESLADGRITRLTSDGSRTLINGTFDWVYEEELDLRNGFRWSPDGRRIAYWQVDASGVRDFLLMDNVDSLYSFVSPVQYPKAGTTNSAVRVGVVSAGGGPTRWLAVPGDPRNHYVARMEWAGNSDEVVIQHLNRLQDTLRVMLGDAATGRVRTVLADADSAWVDVVNDWRWMDGGRRFLWISERDGWRHVYLVSRDGQQVTPVTPGAYDVVSLVRVDEPGGWLYFIASPESATQRFLYRAKLDGTGRAERVTPAGESGVHAYLASPDARWAIHTWSSFDDPPRTELVRLPSHASVRTLVDNAGLRARVAALACTPTEFTTVDAGGGLKVDAWLMKPPGFDPARKYPLLMYVYGEPAEQTVLDEWGGAFYLWHLMLAQQGYVVASVDNRGTPAPRGRAWRKSIYRQMGRVNSADQAAGTRALARLAYVDASRIGIWGWSGGGSSTLNALFRYPDLYSMGMAVAPVTDLRFYDTIYEERYMGLPQAAANDYRLGSPINFVAGLRGSLLVVHGSGDDNVHFQNTEALVNALVAANKQFQMMEYPGRTHGIYEGPNTTRHLFMLLDAYLTSHLPAGPAPGTAAAAGASGAGR